MYYNFRRTFVPFRVAVAVLRLLAGVTVLTQIRGGQRAGAAVVRTVQHAQLVLRLFRGDAGSASHPRPRDRRRTHPDGRSERSAAS